MFEFQRQREANIRRRMNIRNAAFQQEMQMHLDDIEESMFLMQNQQYHNQQRN